MTPLALEAMKASRLHKRHADYDYLCQFQWFDVTPIEQMIDTAIADNRSIEGLSGSTYPPISERAYLPAPLSWFEAQRTDGRCAWVCEEVAGRSVEVRLLTRSKRWPKVKLTAGETRVEFERHADWHGVDKAMAAQLIAEQVEALLCILNQPGLVQPHRKRCHEAERRKALALGHAIGDDGLWTVCKIRLGRHGIAHGEDTDGPVMPLHHVRKHYRERTSARIGRDVWVDSFWRGDASLGIVNKTYIVDAPRKAA